MRASEVRAALATIILAATLDERAGSADRMVQLETPDDPPSARERSFRLVLARQPVRDELTTFDSWVVEYTLAIFYPWSKEIEDRIAADTERLEIALSDAALIALDSEFTSLDIAPSGVEPAPQMLIARWSLVAKYRQDSSIL